MRTVRPASSSRRRSARPPSSRARAIIGYSRPKTGRRKFVLVLVFVMVVTR
ncbi:hypothetical protein ABZ297_05885 [Nonomuraea sp. NPDC005983]|uniref:hypothetical protein n=1 Tax=Nonomuraea sp. NPDC005983 TaxID=3155595 RepID=UPI0033B5DA32